MIVVDANVLVRALRSRNGASHRILRAMLTGALPFALSPAVVIEYEDVVSRPGMLGPTPWISPAEIGVFLDALCAACVPVMPWFRFRPFLADPKDDLYIECALAAGARLVISDDRHFRDPVMCTFGLAVSTAAEFEATWQRKPPVMTSYPLRLPDHIMEQARQAAEEDGVSINHLLTAFVAEGLGHRRGLATLRERAARGNVAAALALLDRAPNGPPDAGDELLTMDHPPR